MEGRWSANSRPLTFEEACRQYQELPSDMRFVEFVETDGDGIEKTLYGFGKTLLVLGVAKDGLIIHPSSQGQSPCVMKFLELYNLYAKWGDGSWVHHGPQPRDHE